MAAFWYGRQLQRLHARMLVVEGDRERMVQSTIEIVSNSIEHLSRGGHITITCQADAPPHRQAVVDVADDGPGIPERARPHVFERFYSSRPRGTGIGLASVKRSVEMDGGEVHVVPRQPPWAHLRVVIPLVGSGGAGKPAAALPRPGWFGPSGDG